MNKKKINLLVVTFVLLINFTFINFSGCIKDGYNVQILNKNVGFNTISEALDYAEEGDTIIVNPGSYKEEFIITKSLVLIGLDRDKTIIEGSGFGDVFYIVADNVTITNLTIINSGDNSQTEEDSGIDIRSENNLIKNVNLTKNNNFGIYLYQAHNNTIEDCVFRNNVNGGIYSLYSNYNLFKNNTFLNNSNGLYLRYAYDSIVSNNSISSHDDKGIYLYASRGDIITDNVFTKNNFCIHIKGAKENIIKKNLFLSNTEGVYFCCGGEENKIYLNNFISNDIHARGNLINEFDNGSIGNYWDDYSGSDEDGDGIGDTIYNVTTSSYSENNIDRFPLMSPS